MKRFFTRRFIPLCVALCCVVSANAEDDDDDDVSLQIEQLQKSITQLQTEIKQVRSELESGSSTTNGKSAATKPSSLYTPNVYGVVMAAFNVSTNNGISRFNVRNTRFGVKGQASRDMSYAMQIDFHNQGSVSVLDAYVKYKRNNFDFRFGQQQINLTKDLNRGPSSNLFSTRSLAAVYSTTYFKVNSDGSESVSSLGSRDIGVHLDYKIDTDIPIHISGGIFNGTGINNAEWDNQVNYTVRVTAGGSKGLFAGASYYTGETPQDQGVDIYSAEVSYNSDKFFAESLYQHRTIDELGDQTQSMGIVVVQSYYNIFTPKSRYLDYIAPVLRWDYGNNVGYLSLADDSVGYTLDFIELVNVHRISAGVNFGLTEGKVRSRLSIGYEKIFMNYTPADFAYNPLMHDKFTVAFTAAF